MTYEEATQSKGVKEASVDESSKLTIKMGMKGIPCSLVVSFPQKWTMATSTWERLR